jgi:hypothetical protein
LAAWNRASGVLHEATGQDPDREMAKEQNPVSQARRLAELSAPADMRLSVALSHGMTLAKLEDNRAGARLASDLAFKRLSIVGLRSGEPVEVEVSDRMRDFLERFFGRPKSDDEPPDPD